MTSFGRWAWRGMLGTLITAGVVGYGCGGGSSADSTGGDGGSGSGGGGVGGGGTQPTPAAGCVAKPGDDLPDDSFDDSNCDGIDGDVKAAIFVSVKGDDSAEGTIQHPVKTLAKGVALAQAAKKYVLVANATYAENLMIDSQSVSIYGGYAVQDWQRTNDRATIAPSAGLPVAVRGASAMVLDHLAFHASDGVKPGESSVAGFIASSTGVTLRHVSLSAGKGADGEKPVAPVAVTTPPTSLVDGAGGASNNGNVCFCSAGCSCGDVSSNFNCKLGAAAGHFLSGTNGGLGGDSGNQAGRAPTAPTNGLPAGLGGVAGTNNSVNGQPGGTGPAGTPGASSTMGVGSVTANGYVASNAGGDGAVGGVGGGGGGGAEIDAQQGACNGVGNYNYFGAGGGAGGQGGAGGAPAKGSTAGGGSIALVTLGSTVALEQAELTSAAGGHGGDSVPGAAGQPGQTGGLGGSTTDACCGKPATAIPAGNGGAGGQGGPGGSGGAGGGGPSVGILSVGTAPTTKGVTTNIGAGGKGGKGVGGAGGAVDGADGLAQDKLSTTASATDGGK